MKIECIYERHCIVGPLLRMMLYIAKDVASFVIFIVAVTCGFLFSIHHIVGGDIDRDVTQCRKQSMEYAVLARIWFKPY